MPARPTIADRLRELLSRRKLDAKKLAEELRIAPRTMTNWTSGTTEPRAEHIAMICDHFDVSADYLIGRRDLECGLVPGTWVVNLDEHERPTGEDDLASEVPARPLITTRKKADEMRAEAQRRADGTRKEDRNA